MRNSVFLAAAMLLAAAATAADIALEDGRVLQDATIRSQTPRTVIIKHAAGMSSVAKALLPVELRSQYPVDEAAALEADRLAALGREAEVALRRAETERLELAREAARQNPGAEEDRQAEAAELQRRELATVEGEAIRATEEYFLNDYERNSMYERTCEVTATGIRPVPGWSKRWTMTGRAVIRRYQPERPEDLLRRPHPDMTAKQIRRARERERFVNLEMREFEATYSTDGEKPSIDVTLR